MSLAQLREAAKNSGIKSISGLKKQELLDLLKQESASVEKAAKELEKFAAAEEQKNSADKAKTPAKRGRSKKEEEVKEASSKSAANTDEASSSKSTKGAGKAAASKSAESTGKAAASKSAEDTGKAAASKSAGSKGKAASTKSAEGTDKASAGKAGRHTGKTDAISAEKAADDASGNTDGHAKKTGKAVINDPAVKAVSENESKASDKMPEKEPKAADKVPEKETKASERINETKEVNDNRETKEIGKNTAETREIRELKEAGEARELREAAAQRNVQPGQQNYQPRNVQGGTASQQNMQPRPQNAQSRPQYDPAHPARPQADQGRTGNGGQERSYQQGGGQDRTNQQGGNNQPRYGNATEGKIFSTAKITSEEREALDPRLSPEIEHLDSGDTKMGILEVMPEGFGFIRCDNFLPGENDVYVSPAQIRKFNLKTGDIISGNTKVRLQTEKFSALLYIKTINGIHPAEAVKRKRFEELTPVFPHERIRLETRGCIPALRIVDLLSPIGKGQRGMIVSQPKAGKTTLLKQIAKAMQINYPELHIIILLIDERPEEVTDMKESIQGSNVEVIYSTFDELPENHKRVSEMAIERAKRLVEHGRDVVVLLDSITRLARAYNLTCQPSGRTLSGGLDPAALHMPKKFFGAARCMREGGSLTVLATALVETGSRMDDVVFEEFKGTGNMELVLDRNLSERRIFPAIDLPRSSTRREDLLLNKDEIDANNILRRAFNSSKAEDVVEKIIGMFARTRSNAEFIDMLKNTRLV
ncbi:MAG: transcription termination factor Rho [Lachnospiraceae bacterium]|nr:transcription termination factor Rho [Lachnospiraceae bacterium]